MFSYTRPNHYRSNLEQCLGNFETQSRMQNLASLSSTLTDNKDNYAIISLNKYLTDALNLSKIENLTIKNLKKILTNIDVNFFPNFLTFN